MKRVTITGRREEVREALEELVSDLESHQPEVWVELDSGEWLEVKVDDSAGGGRIDWYMGDE